jgi:hypothetical protein
VVRQVDVLVEGPPVQEPVRPVEPRVVQVVQHNYAQEDVRHLQTVSLFARRQSRWNAHAWAS